MKVSLSFISALLPIFVLLLTNTECEAAVSSETGTEMYFRVIWAMLLVIGLMLIIYAFVRKRFSLLNNKQESKIQVLEIRPLMPKKSLCLVEVEGNQYLLGLSGDTITHLADIKKSTGNTFSDHLAEMKLNENVKH